MNKHEPEAGGLASEVNTVTTDTTGAQVVSQGLSRSLGNFVGSSPTWFTEDILYNDRRISIHNLTVSAPNGEGDPMEYYIGHIRNVVGSNPTWPTTNVSPNHQERQEQQ